MSDQRARPRYWKADVAVMIVFTVLSIALGFYLMATAKTGIGRAWMGWIAPLYLLIPFLARWLFRLKPAYALDILLYAFIFLAFDFGVAFGGYSKVPFSDKIVHGISGMVFTVIGLCAYYVLTVDKHKGMYYNRFASVGFAFCFTMTTAAFWEFIEYFGFVLTGHDSQNVAATGTGDTMQDMLICMAGGLIVCVLLLYTMKRKHCPFWLRPVRDFFEANCGDPDGEAA